MKKRVLLPVTLLIIAAVVPLLILRVQASLSAGPNQQARAGEPVSFNGTTTDNMTLITQVTWDFGDNSTPVNGSSPALLNATHVYTVGGVYNATLTVVFGSPLNKTDTALAVITVLETVPPVVNAGPDLTLEQESHAGTQVTLNGTATDNVSTRFNFTWTENGTELASETNVTTTSLTHTFNLGMHVVTLNATDEAGNTGTDSATVTIIDTTPPDVNAGPDVTVEAESPAGTEVTLHGTATDICSAQLNLTWTENNVTLGTEQNLTHTFSLGTHIVTLSATDLSGNVGTDNVTVTVTDTTPPDISATVTPSTLWPPNHKYVQVKINVTTSDTADPKPTIKLLSVTSSEPDNAKGDGNTINDIIVIDNYTLSLRAERGGRGTGRTYTLTYQATDASGNTATTTITVTVPHNK